MTARLAFHAAPPAGWINDPVALVREARGYALLVQHRDDAPDFKRVGWARFSSPDLLRWRFDGVAIPPTASHSIYSGCVVRRGRRLEAFHTMHADASGLQSQVRRTSRDGGRRWTEAEKIVSSRRNRRDPFLVAIRNAPRALLLAEPCAWEGWEAQGPSRLVVFEEGCTGWREAARLGPFAPAGVLLEMPGLIRQPAGDLLLVSLVDRRAGGAASTVRAFAGRWEAGAFAAAPDAPAEGFPLDLGPDFYAAIPTGLAGVIVAWLASWQTARRMPWPGFAGGAISLPRRLRLRRLAGRLDVAVTPHIALAPRFTVDAGESAPASGFGVAAFDGRAPFRLRIETTAMALDVEGAPVSGELSIRREGPGWAVWDNMHPRALDPSAARTLRLFLDGPATELFIGPEGRSVTAAVPGARRTVTLEVRGRRRVFRFACLPDLPSSA